MMFEFLLYVLAGCIVVAMMFSGTWLVAIGVAIFEQTGWKMSTHPQPATPTADQPTQPNEIPRVNPKVTYYVADGSSDFKFTPLVADGNLKFTPFVPDQPPPVPSSAFAVQIGGEHYKNLPIQPIEYCQRNGLGAVESFVVKYVTRWRTKGGVEDLRKAVHLLEMLIEMETTQRDNPST